MPASKAQQRAVAKYMAANYDEIKIRLPKGEKDRIKDHAQNTGESVNALIARAINETILKDKSGE